MKNLISFPSLSNYNSNSKDSNSEGGGVNTTRAGGEDSGTRAEEEIAWSKFTHRVEETGWLDHIRTVVASSVLVAEKLFCEGASVLVHCSDGWDRTAQVCATSQLILDPYYRTIQGFCVLVEKDWTGFGHKFHDRVGHCLNSASDDCKEVSPVFLQWLDCISQMLDQFPGQFEFNEDYLVFIADSLNSCLFGTFLGNSEKARKLDLLADKQTVSLWSFALDERNAKAFKNPSSVASKEALWPNPRKVRLWERYFCRWDNDFHPRNVTGKSFLFSLQKLVNHQKK